jgi:glycosyltransferase involved in cell wall biosynthesis
VAANRPGVLMVTGAYFPEVSGGGLQCKALVAALRADVRFAVLTTCTDSSLKKTDTIEGTAVRRVFVDVKRRWSKVAATWAMARGFLGLAAGFDIVHLHGFSQKSILVVLLAKLLGKRVVLTLHTAGQDEPGSVSRQGRLASWAYRRADLYIAISAPLTASLTQAGVAPSRLWRVSNGLDTRRFRPAAPGEQARLRRTLGLPEKGLLLLFVGFFSADKGPHVLFEAWRRLAAGSGALSSVVYVGATKSRYYEVDQSLASDIRQAAERDGLAGRVIFVEEVLNIELYYRAADIFVFPTRREAFGMVLVEAMASGLPCVASRLAGVTDDIVRDGETGLLVEPHDTLALEGALTRVIADPPFAAQLGAAARHAVETRFAIEQTARRTLDAYRYVLNPSTIAMARA